jgi:chorismate synthase
MSGNTLGKIFCVTSFGESHGPAIGCVVDGCPPGLELSVEEIQQDLDRRKPGTSRHVAAARIRYCQKYFPVSLRAKPLERQLLC